MTERSELGAVILCGGHSRRMGRPKAWLRFGGETLLQRATRTLAQVAQPIIVVAAPGQTLPYLPPGVRVVRDDVADRGPLQGIASGLAAIEQRAQAAFVTATDAPFLCAAFVTRLAALRGEHEIAVPHTDGYHHPLAAIYAVRLHLAASELLAAGRHRPVFLFEAASTYVADREALLADPALREADPELRSLRNLNTPEDYQQALQDAGLPPE